MITRTCVRRFGDTCKGIAAEKYTGRRGTDLYDAYTSWEIQVRDGGDTCCLVSYQSRVVYTICVPV
jgi:hypothetical protein